MYNQEAKNWNNFFLGLLVVILPWLSLPEKLRAGLISFLALLIVLFSLARVRGRRSPAPKIPDLKGDESAMSPS